MIQIRKAIQEDANTIVDFQVKMAKETENLELERNIVEKGVEAVFNDSGKGLYFVAEENNIVVASLMITYEWSDWRNGLVYWIQSVYVVDNYRKKGVFRLMYEHIKTKVSQDESLRGIRLYVDKTNTKAINVYNRIGMNGEHYQLFEWMK
jgi:GNAT superfamily N-acetyltransferase